MRYILWKYHGFKVRLVQSGPVVHWFWKLPEFYSSLVFAANVISRRLNCLGTRRLVSFCNMRFSVQDHPSRPQDQFLLRAEYRLTQLSLSCQNWLKTFFWSSLGQVNRIWRRHFQQLSWEYRMGLSHLRRDVRKTLLFLENASKLSDVWWKDIFKRTARRWAANPQSRSIWGWFFIHV